MSISRLQPLFSRYNSTHHFIAAADPSPVSLITRSSAMSLLTNKVLFVQLFIADLFVLSQTSAGWRDP
jgi:hypothetical protein